jgi:glycosyltransferase involved in cell wall biosynthesis
MAQGRLLVASDVGGHKELIRHGHTGMLFKAGSASSLADTLLQVIAKQDMWPELRRAGRWFVETERNWRVSVANYRAAYQAVLGGDPDGL